jgi:serine/threonine protein phosphatase PrpC
VHRRATALKTTLSVLVCLPGEALLAHVGDCRVVLMRDGGTRQLTRDHSWSRDLGALGWVLRGGRKRTRHVLHRALGDQPMVRVDTAQMVSLPGDRFVLCSDGVWGGLSASAFAALVLEPLDDQSLAERLTREALAAGSTDDASAVVVSVPLDGV